MASSCRGLIILIGRGHEYRSARPVKSGRLKRWNVHLEFDFVVIGAGSAGCAAAHGLATRSTGTIGVLEAGVSDAVPQVKIPFGLLYTMGSGRDWNFRSTAQSNARQRNLKVNRGKMLGGSSSINSMVWFRGRTDDFENWQVPGWAWKDVQGDFEAVEDHIRPDRLPDPHPLSQAFGLSLGSNGHAPPTPERESAGIFHTNMRHGRRWSAADAFLRPAVKTGRISVLTGATTDRIVLEGRRAKSVLLTDGRTVTARNAMVLCAGSIGSPSILMRSGIGPAQHLQDLGIPVRVDQPTIGRNLHDHPVIGVHHRGPRSGYGLTIDQAAAWVAAPLWWLATRKGRMTSNFVEAGAFFRAAPVAADGDNRPDVQTHFIPYMMGYKGRQITTGSGYYADVGICRPLSRGRLQLTSSDPHQPPDIDLGILSHPSDLELLTAAFKKLRLILGKAPFGARKAPEVFPGSLVSTDEEIAEYVRSRCGTAYHPVGTLKMGTADTPVTPDLAFRGIEGLWVADASIMPNITSANTNAPSIMIGHRAAKLLLAAL